MKGLSQAALAQVGENAQAQQVLSLAFAIARLAGRRAVFQMLKQGATTLAVIDQGQTLWRVHEELIAIEDWWGVGVQ